MTFNFSWFHSLLTWGLNIPKDLVFFILPPLKTPCLDFLGRFHSHWLTVLTVGEFPSLTALGVTVCEQEQTGLGDSLHLSSCITEGKKGTYLPKPTNPSSAGLCHVAWWTSAERWNSWSLQRPQSGLPLPLSLSLPSFFPFLLMSRELFCQIVRNLQQTGSPSPAYVHVCVHVCAHLCMMDGGGGENVGRLQIP